MCYHASVGATYKQLEEEYERPFLGDLFPSFYNPNEVIGFHLNGFEFPAMPVITNELPHNIQMFKWGLIPNWATDYKNAQEIRSVTLNAKSETVFEKPSFKIPILQQRCLVLATGFYEWMQVDAKTKIPYYIHVKESPIFAFAGIYDYWKNEAEDAMYKTFSILTTEANKTMAQIHNTKKRMPLILSKSQENHWLNANATNENLKEMMQPIGDSLLETWTISKLITSKKEQSNVPEVLLPFNYQKPLDLFS
jgi:putative SOS response-associated peptidase YedK